jgi:cytochrome bd ubiquinol oxidase subunit II
MLRSRERPAARAKLAVAAIIAGWALAQRPLFLPGLTIRQAAAPHDTLVAVIVGGAILFPSLGLLFRLTVSGRLDHAAQAARPARPARALLRASTPGLLARLAGAFAFAGIALLTGADAGWAHAIGVAFLLGFIVAAFLAATPAELAKTPPDEPGGDPRRPST